jgi:hypothetical protein
MDGMMNISFPNNGMVWGSASTRDATSWVQIHDQGMATVLTVVSGLTYWVTMFAKRPNDSDDIQGNLGSTEGFGQRWSPSIASEDVWDHEGVLLAPGDIL